MTSNRALAIAFDNSDRHFFAQHPDRQARIRLPYADECKGEFWSLGEHNRARRRILLWRVPEHHPAYDPKEAKILRIPFLLFSDETVEDTDAVLLPVIHKIMLDAQKKQRVRV